MATVGIKGLTSLRFDRSWSRMRLEWRHLLVPDLSSYKTSKTLSYLQGFISSCVGFVILYLAYQYIVCSRVLAAFTLW